MSLIAILVASLIGSAHCAGMCGGFVACYSGSSNNSLFPHVAYNLGRLQIYVTFGALAGLLGAGVDDFGFIFGFQRISAVLTGALLIIWGLKGLIQGSDIYTGKSSWFYSQLQKVFSKFLSGNLSWTTRAYLLGSFSSFLPCGWLYSFLAVAAATASPLSGALTMAVFWIGTVPALVSVAGVSKLLSVGLRQYIPRVTSVLLLTAGLFSLLTKNSLSVEALRFEQPSSENHQTHVAESCH